MAYTSSGDYRRWRSASVSNWRGGEGGSYFNWNPGSLVMFGIVPRMLVEIDDSVYKTLKRDH